MSDLDLQGQFGLQLIDFCIFELVHTITCQGFKLEMPYLHRMCTVKCRYNAVFGVHKMWTALYMNSVVTKIGFP